MTRVFDRPIEGAKTRAFILGIGRFPSLPPINNIQACVDSAVGMINFLYAKRDDLLQPLATIDCLLSEPGVARNSDSLAKLDPTFDPRADTAVESATADKVVNAFATWTEACDPGDCLIVYACTHGLATTTDIRNMLVLEDFGAVASNPGNYLLDASSIVRSLAAAKKASSVWIFLDACSNFDSMLAAKVDGVRGRQVVSADITEVTAGAGKTMALIASQLGGVTGTDATGLAYFTRALIEGLSTCLVEPNDGRWVVTNTQIGGYLGKFSHVGLGLNVAPKKLEDFSAITELMPVAKPRVPILVRSEPEALLRFATNATISSQSNPAVPLCVRQGGNPEWRCWVDIEEQKLVIDVVGPTNLQKPFDLQLPCMDFKVSAP